jgi:hypothetical protein
MANKDKQDPKETLPLALEEGPRDEASPWFVHVRRRNLIRLLSAGVIGPPPVIAKYRRGDVLGLDNEHILCFRNGLSAGEIEGLAEDNGPTDIPILLEIDKGFVQELLREQLKAGESDELAALPCVIPVNAISRAHFRNADDLADFSARQFENLPSDKLSTAISSDLFSYERSSMLKGQASEMSIDQKSQAADLESSAALADRIAGGLAMLSHTLPGRAGWVEALTGLLRGVSDCLSKPEGSEAQSSRFLRNLNELVHASTRSLIGAGSDSVDEVLLLSTMTACCESDISEGWDPESFIAHIVDQVGQLESDASIDEVKKWHEFCLRVLRNEIDLPRSVFADERDVVRRAIFLFVLRPDVDDVVASTQSTLKAGASVRTIAAMLSGMRMGFEALPNTYKADRQRYEGFAELKSWLTNALWKGRDLIRELVGDPPAVKTKNENYKSAGAVGREKVQLGGFQIAEVLLELPPALREVWNRAESDGLQIEFDEVEERLVVKYVDGAIKQEVYVTDLGSYGRHHLVRFWSPCLDVSTPSKLRKLTKDKAVCLLEQNGAPSTHARFALDTARGTIIAAVDQVAATMQKEELRSHLSSVVNLLHWFQTGGC